MAATAPNEDINYVELLNQMAELPNLTDNIKQKQTQVTAQRQVLTKTIQDMLILVNGLQTEIKNIKGKGSEEVKKIKQAIKQAKATQENTIQQSLNEITNLVDLQGLETNVNNLYGKIKSLRDTLDDSGSSSGSSASGTGAAPTGATLGGYTYGARKRRRRTRAKGKKKGKKSSRKKYF
jgi:flagellar capping protein FliD